MKFINSDICDVHCDAIVNAANGVGYMGGLIGIFVKRKGVAENIHYITKGKVSKDAKKYCITKRTPFGLKACEVFVTNAYELPCKYIIHAVTMHYPGTKSNLITIDTLIDRIIDTARKNKFKSIAIPLLGTGTGGLDKNEVRSLYKQKLDFINDIVVYVVEQ